ncbi:MAG: F0F1 ATP synthase subunit A [Alphaproteobacteria bacterium]|nr:F0F1 ATP synthase subunit A [Alphaproteobacteria bacterium]
MLENYDTTIMFSVGGFPVNATIFYSWVVMAVCVIVSWFATRRLTTSLKPSKWQLFMEMIVLFLHTETKETSGDNPKKYIGIVTALFMFIAVANLLTIFPFYKPPTASLSTTFAFAFVVFLAIPYYGIKNAGLRTYLKKFISPTPIMLPLNLISDITSSMALAFRLYGNVISGVMFGVVLGSFMPFLLPLPMSFLGLLTGTIQAYIFALLAVVYASSVSPEENLISERS